MFCGVCAVQIFQQLRFAATRAGLTQLATWLGDLAAAEVQIGLEATGIYWLTLHAWLQQWGAAQGSARTNRSTSCSRNSERFTRSCNCVSNFAGGGGTSNSASCSNRLIAMSKGQGSGGIL